jgi:tetratricopeptide (TPR) repeat protein
VFGSVLCELQEFDMAAAVIAQMLRMADDLGETRVTSRACWLAALAYARMGKPEQAVTQLERARKTLSPTTMPMIEWLRLCRSTASVMLSLGDPESALDWIEAADMTATLTGLGHERAAVTLERARYESATGHVDVAAELYRSVCGPDSALKTLDLVTALNGLADALQQLGRIDEAIDVFRRTAETCDETGNYRQAAQAWRRVDELGRMAKPGRRSRGKSGR